MILSLDTFIGQTRAKSILKEMISGWKVGKIRPSHMLFESGYGGTGKTTLASIYAQTINAKFVITNTSGASAKSIGILIKENKPLDDQLLMMFLEEWNQNRPDLDNFFRPFLENQLILIDGSSYFCNYINRIVVLIASNNIACFSQPLISRLDVVKMEEYSNRELIDITHMYMKQYQVDIDEEGVSEIVSRSRGIPRTIVKIIQALNRVYRTEFKPLTLETVTTVAERRGFLINGLNELDIRLMKLLYDHEALSLSALSGMTGESPEAVRLSEAFLLKNSYIKITNKRVLTDLGYSFVFNRFKI